MKTQLVSTLVTALLASIPDNLLKDAVDSLLDKIEDKVAETPNKWDDITVLPLCNMIRNTFGISDDDEPAA